MERSPEFQTLLTCNSHLTAALRQNPLSIANGLLSKGFISQEVHSQMLLPTLTNGEKVSRMLIVVRDAVKIAQNPQEKFKNFLQVIQEFRWTEEIENILWTKYCELRKPIDTSETSSELITRETHDKDANTKLFLLIATSVTALIVILFAQSTLVTLVTAVMTIPTLLAIGDGILRKRSILWSLSEVWSGITVFLGNTLGNFIPYKCPYCGVWSRISSYGGNVVQGYAECPECHRDIFNPSQTYK